jgi:Fe-S cluster assembly protein SufD
VAQPLHVLFISEPGAEPSSSLPRLFVVLERGASATLVEEYQGKGRYLTCAVTEVTVRENASLDHQRIQRESVEAFHFSSLAARVERDGQYACRTITFGGRLSRSTPQVTLAEPGAGLVLEGLALLGEGQLADTHSFIDHTVPHCTSRQAHKTIADGDALAVFNGIIYVRKDAQGTDAQQQCRGLLLSAGARIDAKPQLEIYADDVKCNHGATVGQLDPEELFYLQSRGLNADDARNLLTYGFAADVLNRIPVASLRRALRHLVMARTQAGSLGDLS